MAFDLPTQMGIDSDAPRAAGEVGRVGVAIDSVDDMHQLLRDLPLQSGSLGAANGPLAAAASAQAALAAQQTEQQRVTTSVTGVPLSTPAGGPRQ